MAAAREDAPQHRVRRLARLRPPEDGSVRLGNVDAVLALVIAPVEPNGFIVTDADREALARVTRANVPTALLGATSEHAALERCAARLATAGSIIEVSDLRDARAFALAANELGVVPKRLYAAVDDDAVVSAASLAGAVVLRLGSGEVPTLRDAVERLSAPIARSALMLRALVAHIGVED